MLVGVVAALALSIFANVTAAAAMAAVAHSDCKAAPAPHVDWAGCNKSHADLELANLYGADLIRATLTGANLKSADLKGVTWNDTVCPDGTNSNNDGGSCKGHLTS
ncbi:MAG: pentapeptide repeat-containing protein [Acidimicrobiales bacterium]